MKQLPSLLTYDQQERLSMLLDGIQEEGNAWCYPIVKNSYIMDGNKYGYPVEELLYDTPIGYDKPFKDIEQVYNHIANWCLRVPQSERLCTHWLFSQQWEATQKYLIRWLRKLFNDELNKHIYDKSRIKEFIGGRCDVCLDAQFRLVSHGPLSNELPPTDRFQCMWCQGGVVAAKTYPRRKFMVGPYTFNEEQLEGFEAVLELKKWERSQSLGVSLYGANGLLRTRGESMLSYHQEG